MNSFLSSFICWITAYPVDKVIRSLNNWSPAIQSYPYTCSQFPYTRFAVFFFQQNWTNNSIDANVLLRFLKTNKCRRPLTKPKRRPTSVFWTVIFIWTRNTWLAEPHEARGRVHRKIDRAMEVGESRKGRVFCGRSWGWVATMVPNLELPCHFHETCVQSPVILKQIHGN